MFEILRDAMSRVEDEELARVNPRGVLRILRSAVQDCLDGCEDLMDEYALPDDDEMSPIPADDLFISDD
jgi:hypothetical protein